MTGRQPARRYPAPLPPQPEGLRGGTCARHPNPSLWASSGPPGQDAAIALCRTCPVLQPCRAWALSVRTADDLILVLGGLTARERAQLRTARQRALTTATAPPEAPAR